VPILGAPFFIAQKTFRKCLEIPRRFLAVVSYPACTLKAEKTGGSQDEKPTVQINLQRYVEGMREFPLACAKTEPVAAEARGSLLTLLNLIPIYGMVVLPKNSQN
jgi:hypothetical protein